MNILAPAEPLTLVTAEVYAGWQGEGASAGTRCAFIRLGGCNLTCGWRRTPAGLERAPGAWACDEAATWHPGHGMHQLLTRRPVTGLAKQALASAPLLVVITGGEPLIHQSQPGWERLLTELLAAWPRPRIEIETNGTLVPSYVSNRISHNVSPKLASSGLDPADAIRTEALDWHAAHGSVFKFVAASPADIDEAAGIAAAHSIPAHRVWIMPEGITPDRILLLARQLTPHVAARGYNLTLRQHVLIYGSEREPR